METRSRKRAEASSSQPSPKRSRMDTNNHINNQNTTLTNPTPPARARRANNRVPEPTTTAGHRPTTMSENESSALQGLLRKLGNEGGSSANQSGCLKNILSGLRADGEDGKQIEALTQLCEILSIGTEDSLSNFSIDSFVPVLVGLLNHRTNPDIMLLAARAITHLCDVLPASCATVVHYGAVNCFVARLLTIEYMDLAEQSLQALKKISQEHPIACLRAGSLMAVLSYLDFFSTGVQRVALATAANICKKLSSDAGDFVMEAVPLLINLLQYHDAKVLEHASVCLTRIAEAFASSADKLDELCNHGLVTQAASLISTSNSGGGQTSLNTPTYTGLIRLLSICASGSPLGTKILMLLGISRILKDILSGSGLVANIAVFPALNRPPDQIFEIVNLANELLPPLPQGTISLPVASSSVVKESALKNSSDSSSGKHDDGSGSAAEASARVKLLDEQPELLQQFGMDLLPVLIQLHGSSVNGSVRHKCISVIGKLMYFSSAEMIQTLISVTNIPSFLAGVLAWKDPQILIPALQIADTLMEKLPETFSKMFVREGVVYAVDALILPVSTEKNNDSITGTSRRRYRRKVGNPSADLQPTDISSNPALVIGSPPTSLEGGNSSLRTTVSTCAKTFKDKYFPSGPGDSKVGVTEDLLHLKNLCTKLNAAGVDDRKTKQKGKSKASTLCFSDMSASKEAHLVEVVSEMLTELSKGDGVSTFEFIGSGVVDALLNYFSCGCFSKDKVSETNLSKLRQQAVKRYKTFLAVALASRGNGSSDPPFSIIVQKLQNALSSLERFPVMLSHASQLSGGNSRSSSVLSALTMPIKLRLCRGQGEKSLRDYSSNIVLIDPLASLAAVEDFLWPRVQRSESGQNPSASAANSESKAASTGAGALSTSTSTPASTTNRPSTRSRSSVNIAETTKKESAVEKSAGSSKGKGKAVLKISQKDASRGPRTRNATRRTAALEKDLQMNPGDSSSEDEEVDLPHAEEDELMIEGDDISDEDEDEDEDEDGDEDDQDLALEDNPLPVCMPDVHDVKLGDSAQGSREAPETSDNQTNPVSGSSSIAATARGSDSTVFRTGATFRSRETFSFAASAMSGLASANGRGLRGGRDPHGHPLSGSKDPPKLSFSSGRQQLTKHLTIFQAIQSQLRSDEDEEERSTGTDLVSSDGSRLWGDIYTLTYHKADNQTDEGSVATSNTATISTKSGSLSANRDASLERKSLLDSILQAELPCDLERSNATYNILALLRVLEGLNQLAPRLRVQILSDRYAKGLISSLDEFREIGLKVPQEEFISNKLTPKLSRQIQDALALCSGSLPPWCYQLTKACPFLFPFETRCQYLYSTAFGLSRALNRLQQQHGPGQGSASEREIRVGRLQRQKVRVSRNRILDSAAKVMEMYSSQKAVLEVEYFGEVGTGLGPTLEFYTLLSHDLQKAGLGMWRSNSPNITPMEVEEDNCKVEKSSYTKALEPAGGSDIVQAPLGLFPRPWPCGSDLSEGSQFFKVIEYFQLLGCVMAKALQDGRLLDMTMSTAFYKLVLGQELDLHDIASFDAELGRTMQELQAISGRKLYIESIGNEIFAELADLTLRGASIEDLCLDFTLPGYPDYALKPAEVNVDLHNLEEYISLVVDATVKTGITRQMEAFRAGFNKVFDITTLQIFSPFELDNLLCGRREMWKAETLIDHLKFDHGYTARSPAIVNLLDIMVEFTTEQQQAFCQFVTGAPRLPPGGLAVLNPKLTIVRKISSTAGNSAANGSRFSESTDDDLPSVMTCANYLKLPPYSTKEIMRKKLLYAINEGQGSFDLS